MRSILLNAICTFVLVGSQAYAAEVACPTPVQARQALSLVADKAADRAYAAMKGDAAQMDALRKSDRIAKALLQYRDECIQKTTDLSGALRGEEFVLGLFDKYSYSIDVLVRASTSMDRFRNAKLKLDESGSNFQALVKQFVKIQGQKRSAKTHFVGQNLPDEITILLNAANRIGNEDILDPEAVFLLGRTSNTLSEALDKIPETFRQEIWGNDAKALTELSKEMRKQGTAALIATGGILANIQQLVMTKRTLSELRAIEPKACAEFLAQIPSTE